MKVHVEVLGLPLLARLIGKKIEMTFDGSTVADMVSHIIGRYGNDAKKALLDQDGNLDYVVQVMVNNEGIMPRDQHDKRELKDGDDVKFMLLVGGG